MTPSEKMVYQERYDRLREKLRAAGEDVDYLEYPNCWLAVEAGANCIGPDPKCNAPLCYFPCEHCTYIPEAP